MSDLIKAALIIGVTIIGGTGIWVYFSPYHSCVRAGYEGNWNGSPEIRCAALLGGRR